MEVPPLPKSKKKPDEMTTDEAVEHLFPKPLSDALRDAVTEKDEEIEEATDEP